MAQTAVNPQRPNSATMAQFRWISHGRALLEYRLQQSSRECYEVIREFNSELDPNHA